MTRTYPTDGLSPIDAYSDTADIALGYFQWDVSGTSTVDGDGILVVKLADSSTTTSGTLNAIVVDIDSSGTHTSGSKWINGINIDMNITGNFYRYMAGINIGWSITEAITSKNNYGIYMYFDDMGSGATDAIIPLGIDRNITSGTVAGDWDCFARFVTHGAGYATTIFSFEGSPYIATYLFHFEHPTAPISSSATALSGITTSYKIAIRAGSNVCYIPVVSTGMS